MITPVDYKILEVLLTECNYDTDKTKRLVAGFRDGFSLEYEGNEKVKITSQNLKLNVGNETILWNKVMKEVKNKCYAGPFEEVPYEYFLQSPIGLVPKDGGRDTRLIFHLSHPRNRPGVSVNSNIPANKCKVNYPDFVEVVRLCLHMGRSCKMAKLDMALAFRHLGVLRKHWRYLVMKARNPLNGKTYYFIDKCIAFRSSISCKHFQDFSDGIAAIVHYKAGGSPSSIRPLVNYLNDYFFVALVTSVCNALVKIFLEVCALINFPIALEKTYWACTSLVFLGMLLDTDTQTVLVPVEKIQKAKNLICEALQKKSRKITLRNLQKLCGYLNFMCRCIVPGRTFTQRLYPQSIQHLKPHHHLKITEEMKQDLLMWLKFLEHPAAYCRPFADFEVTLTANKIKLYTDAALLVGFGGYCNRSWYYGTWDKQFLDKFNLSIGLLELYALTTAILMWIHRFKNRRVVLFCDNLSVIYMINQSSSHCRHCMKLIRLITLESMIHNVRIFAKHVPTLQNQAADLLSRAKIDQFKAKFPEEFDEEPTRIDSRLWPVSKLLEY